MAEVVASKVRKQRAIALSLKDSKAGEEDGKSRLTEVGYIHIGVRICKDISI